MIRKRKHRKPLVLLTALLIAVLMATNWKHDSTRTYSGAKFSACIDVDQTQKRLLPGKLEQALSSRSAAGAWSLRPGPNGKNATASKHSLFAFRRIEAP